MPARGYLFGGSVCESNPPGNVNSTTCKAADGTEVHGKQRKSAKRIADRSTLFSLRQFTFNLRLTLWLRLPLDALTMIV